MIRREKAKVLTQLPDKTRTDLYVEISNREEYLLAQNDLAEYLRQYKDCTDREIRRKMRMEALVKIMALRSIAAKGKVKQAIDLVRVVLAADRAHRIGQKDNVTCYYLLGQDTIDSTLYGLIYKKKSIAGQIMASDDDIPQSEAYFDELIAAFMNDNV